MYLLHFVAFYPVASLLSTGVDNEKALEVDNRIIFSHFSLISIYKYHPKMQQNILLHSGKHFGLNSICCCLKMKSILNILGYFLEQFQIFSRGLQPLENL